MNRIYAALGAKAEERFIFCENPTDLALLSAYIGSSRKTGKNHFLTTPGNDLIDLGTFGVAIKYVPLNANGQVTVEALQNAVGPRTCLLSLAWADGLTGVIQPIAEISEFCKQRDILLHVDATHVIGKLYFRFQDLAIDYLTFDGGLLVKEKTFVRKLKTKVNTSLADELVFAVNNFEHLCTETARLRDKFEKLVGGKVLFQKSERLPNISVLEFDGAHPDALQFLLSKKGIDAEICNEALSFTFTHKTTQEEIEKMAAIVNECVKKLRTYSHALSF